MLEVATLDDYAQRFGGTTRLYGAQAAHNLPLAHVVVVGIGGVGSWTAEALARSGVGRLTLIDLDNIALSNINRQVHALGSTWGKSKVAAMQERIADINPDCQVHAIEEFVEADNWSTLMPRDANAVVDACDQWRAKMAMMCWALHSKKPFISAGAAGGKRNAQLIRIADLAHTTHDPLLAKLRYQLRKQKQIPGVEKKSGIHCVYSSESVALPQNTGKNQNVSQQVAPNLHCAGYGSSVAVTATFGMVAASWILEKLVSAKALY